MFSSKLVSILSGLVLSIMIRKVKVSFPCAFQDTEVMSWLALVIKHVY